MPAFVCSNFWQTVARHHVDLWHHETKHLYQPSSFKVDHVRRGDVVFVKTDFLDAFVTTLLPSIANPFVLVTGHSDLSPSQHAMETIHSSPRVLRWYCVNALWTDHKTVALPLGLSEPDRPIGDQAAVHDAMAAVGSKERKVWCPAAAPTHPSRQLLDSLDHPCLVKEPGTLAFKDYLTTLGRYEYVLCPRGNGADVHRVHEAILMRTVPIYVSDQVPALFKRLPVIVVQSLADVLAMLDSLSSPDVDWPAAQKYLSTARVPEVYGLGTSNGS